MREVKFRGLTEEGEWVDGFLAREDMIWYWLSPGSDGGILKATGIGGARLYNEYTVDPKTVGQFIGLKDKNGTEIYEGDIVRFCDFASDRTGGHKGDSIITGIVTYDYAMWFINDDQNNEVGFPLCDAHLNDDEFEVIGNIHENPELLEESK